MLETTLIEDEGMEEDSVQTPPDESAAESLFDYNIAKQRLTDLVAQFESVKTKVKSNREWRNVDLNLKKLRLDKEIKEDDIMVPVRVIDTNIKRETPPFVNYLKQSRRLLTFKARNNPGFIPDRMENEFYVGMTYPKWERPWLKLIDGSKTHGGDWMEVVRDTSKPFQVGLEHIGKDRLIHPIDAEDIQACELISRVFRVSPRQLKRFVTDWGFDGEQIRLILDGLSGRQDREKKITVHRLWFKTDNVVNVGWMSLDASCSDWLSAPKPLWIGRMVQVEVPNPAAQTMVGSVGVMLKLVPPTVQEWQDDVESSYPIYNLPNQETEQPNILDVPGRVFLDKHKQEAATTNLSAFLSGLNRAAGVYASPSNLPESAAKFESMKLESGKILPEPINFWAPNAPPPSMLAVAQYLSTLNSEEVGQVAYAVNNRQDTEKTATEVKSARQDQTMLSSVGLTLFSTTVREVYSFVFDLARNVALQGKIPFMLLTPTEEAPYLNDESILRQQFDIRAAGDVDVIERQELIQRYKEFWPIIANTPIAMQFLAKLVKLSFPDDGEEYSKMLSQGDPAQLLLVAGQIIQGLLADNPDVVQRIPPEQQAQLAEFMNVVNGLIASRAKVQGQQGAQPPGAGAAKPNPTDQMASKGAEGGLSNAS